MKAVSMSRRMHGADSERQQLILGIATEGFWEWDMNSNLLFLSPRYCQLTGYTHSCADIETGFIDMAHLPDSLREYFSTISDQLRSTQDISTFTFPVNLLNGTVLWMESRYHIVKRDSNGRPVKIAGTVTDISERRRVEEQLFKLNRSLLAISACNQALLRADNEIRLLEEICHIIVETGGYRMAWVGYAENDLQKSVRRVAQAGFDTGYLDSLSISWADVDLGRGPTGTAIRTGQPCSVRHMISDPKFLPWRNEAIKHGYASVQSLPMKKDNTVFGALTIYSAIPDAFTSEETELLSSLVNNLAYGISMLQNRKAREKAEEELRQSEARYRSLFQNRHVVMLIIEPETGRIIDANPAAVHYYGWGMEELLNMNISEINQLTEQEIKAEMKRAWNKQCNYFMFRHRRADNTVRDVEVTSGPITIHGKSLLYSIVNDVTERKQFQKLILESNTRMHFILSATNAGLWESDLSSTIKIWADEVWSPYGIEPHSGELSYRNFLKTIFPEDRATIIQATRDAIRHGTEFNGIWRVRDTDGTVRWLMSKGAPFRDINNKLVRYVGIVVDISDRKKQEEEKQQLEVRVRKIQRLETIGTLAGGIAHDFNNILTPILGYAEMGAISLDKEHPVHEFFTEIIMAAERARNLVSQILTFSKAQETTTSIVNIQSVIAEALKLLRPSIPSNISIQQHVAPSCRNIAADPSQIHQVIVNLCTNAFQAIGESEGVITIELREVVPDSHLLHILPKPHAESYAKLTISDTGVGMDEATIERIFEPFFTTKPVNKGTGLGLSVVHGIVTGYKGHITIESMPEKGSSFHVHLPVIDMQVADAPDESTHTGGKNRILFVDDEQANLKIMTIMLTQLGYRIKVSRSPLQAIELFRRTPGQYDLVITDRTMPGMNGIDLAAELHKIRPEIPIILMTGMDKESDAITSLEHYGICSSLRKPVKLAKLAATINKVISSWPHKHH